MGVADPLNEILHSNELGNTAVQNGAGIKFPKEKDNDKLKGGGDGASGSEGSVDPPDTTLSAFVKSTFEGDTSGNFYDSDHEDVLSICASMSDGFCSDLELDKDDQRDYHKLLGSDELAKHSGGKEREPVQSNVCLDQQAMQTNSYQENASHLGSERYRLCVSEGEYTIVSMTKHLSVKVGGVSSVDTPCVPGAVMGLEKTGHINSGKESKENGVLADSSSPSHCLLMKQPEQACVEEKTYSRQRNQDWEASKPQGSSCLEDQKKGFDKFFPKPRMGNSKYCCFFANNGVCFRPTCHYKHQMSLEVENYVGHLVLHYLTARKAQKAWELIDIHTRNCPDIPLLPIFLLVPLARHIVEESQQLKLTNIKVPAHLTSPLDIAKVCALCETCRGSEAYQLLRSCYGNASVIGVQRLIGTFIRYCESWPEEEAESPWEKVLLWKYEEEGHPGGDKIKEMFDIGWLMVNIGCRKINRVCEVYGYLSSRLSAPSSFFTSITCSVITFLNDTGNRKMSFHILKEVRRLRANDSSIFIALIPTDKESAMAVLPELSEMGNLVCELLVPLPTCSWDLLLTLIMSTRNLTLSISLLICAMKINSYKPDIGVLEELLLDCSQGGSLLMHSLSIVICGLSAEYLMRLRPTLHSLINLLAGAPPPAPQATDNIIRHCQAQGINLQPHAKVSPNVMQKKGVFSNNAEKRVCPLVEMHHKKSSLLTSGNLSRGRGRQTVQVVSDMSFGYQNDQSLENSRSAVKLGYHSDYIESNRKPLLGPGSGCNDSYDAENKNLKAYYNYSSGSYKNYIPPSNSTEYRSSKNCRDIAFGMRYSDSHMRESRTLIDFSYQCNVSSSVGPYRHQTLSTGPGSQAQPISSSALDYQSQPISLSGSDFQNWTTPSTCFDHYQTMSASLSSDHNWPHMVSVRYKTRPSAVIGNSLENLGDNTQGYRQGVRNIRTGEFNEQRQNRKGHDIPQYPQPECHGQTSTRGDYFKSVSEFCRRSPLVDATVVAPRHPSAPSNSMSLASGSCSNTYKQEELVGRVANGISTVEAGEKTDNMELTQHQQTQLFIPLSSEVTEGVGSEPVKDTTPRGSCINQSVINNVHMLKRKPKPDNNNNNNNNNTVSLKRKHEEPCYPRKESKTSSELSSCSRGKLDQLDQRKEQADMCCMSQPSISLTSGHKMLQSEEIHKSLPYLDSNSEHSQGYYSVRPKQLGVIQGSNFSQMGVEQRLTEELRPPVSHTSSSTLPHYLKIDIAGHSFSPNNYRTNYRQFEEWMGEFDVNSRESLITTVSLIQNMIAGSHSLSQRRLQLMQIVTMLTEGDAIYSVGKKVAAILKFFIGSRNWRRRPISDAEREWIGQLGVTIFVKCIKRNILTEAASVINTLHNRNIFFYSHTPITDTRYEHFSDQRLALMALEVLSRVHNFEVFNQILDEVYWSGGTGDIKIRLRIIAKVLDTLFEALTTGAYKVREKTLRWMTKILVSLAKYYHHDYHIIKLDYHKILDLPNILIRSWEEAQECGNPKLSSQLSSVICSSMASGVHLPHAFALNFELLRIKKTHAASTASRNRRMSDLSHQKWTNTYWLTLKGPEEGGRSDPGAPSYSKTHTSTFEETRSVHIESRFIKPQINVSDTRNEMIPLGRSAYGDGSGKTHLPTIRSEMEKKTRKDLVLPGCDESFLNKKMGALGGAQVPRNRNGRWSTPKVKHKLKGSKRPLMCRHTLE
ncbi:uncharacterized protein LOC121880481 isoform X2 [Homarus americanus]|nr:uncharacterized protein LOC121880481 isoform X2 [Homarus americanus]XP_042243622.1 uncharacterized protein LOC121880481 isoform X2 [Homarus americanus]